MALYEIRTTLRVAFFLLYCVPTIVVLARWPAERAAEVGAAIATGLGLLAVLVLACLLIPSALLQGRGDHAMRRWQYVALRASVLPTALTSIATFTRVVDSWGAVGLSALLVVALTAVVYEIAERHFPEYAGQW